MFVWTDWQYWLCRRSTTWPLSDSEETQEAEEGQQGTRGFWHASICGLWSGEWTWGQLFHICFFPRPKKNCEADGSDLLNSIGAFWRPWKLKKTGTVRKCRDGLPMLFCHSFKIFIKPTWPWTAHVLPFRYDIVIVDWVLETSCILVFTKCVGVCICMCMCACLSWCVCLRACTWMHTEKLQRPLNSKFLSHSVSVVSSGGSCPHTSSKHFPVVRTMPGWDKHKDSFPSGWWASKGLESALWSAPHQYAQNEKEHETLKEKD